MVRADRELQILGLGGSDHGASAALVQGETLTCAIEEERVTRKKYNIGANLLFGAARKYVLGHAGQALEQMDLVVADEILPATALYPLRRRARTVNHHLLHAASAFYPSDFEEAAILVVDNAGSLTSWDGVEGIETMTFARGRGRQIEVLGKVLGERYREAKTSYGGVYQRGDPDNSLGYFYKTISHYCGFDFLVGHDFYFPEDGKTMGLAPFGTDRYLGQLQPLVQLEAGGQVVIDLHSGALQGLLQQIVEPPLPPEEDLARRADLAWAGQRILEQALRHAVDHLHQLTGCDNLCIAGGVALNCVANGKLLRQGPFARIYVPPACGDSGTSIGAALWGHHQLAGRERHAGESMVMRHAFWGRDYSEAEMREALGSLEGLAWERPADLPRQAAQLLAEGKVLAWFQGGSEIGPRALGHRSILADPRCPGMKDLINERVKHREGFRPFAPSVLAEHQADYFDHPRPSPFMLFVADVLPHQQEQIPAVTHVDGSARLHSVTRADSPRYHEVISAFAAATGVPVVLNTSFNDNGEPIVETPADALRCFLGTGIDELVLGPYLVHKKGP